MTRLPYHTSRFPLAASLYFMRFPNVAFISGIYCILGADAWRRCFASMKELHGKKARGFELSIGEEEEMEGARAQLSLYLCRLAPRYHISWSGADQRPSWQPFLMSLTPSSLPGDRVKSIIQAYTPGTRGITQGLEALFVWRTSSLDQPCSQTL